jgi:DNA-binding Lrp family transcriptional regulator
LQAYVLIQTEPDSQSVAEDLRALPDIVSAEDVTGAYDAIAVVRSDSMPHLTDVVLAKIRGLPGVSRALPAPLLDGPPGDQEGSGPPFRVSVASGQAA